MDSASRPRHVKGLFKLSKASGLYPKCLILKAIDLEPHSVALGGFGDVYKGRLHGQVVAVKILRFSQSDLAKRLKVTSK
jgi:hypothetical protein